MISLLFPPLGPNQSDQGSLSSTFSSQCQTQKVFRLLLDQAILNSQVKDGVELTILCSFLILLQACLSSVLPQTTLALIGPLSISILSSQYPTALLDLVLCLSNVATCQTYFYASYIPNLFRSNLGFTLHFHIPADFSPNYTLCFSSWKTLWISHLSLPHLLLPVPLVVVLT